MFAEAPWFRALARLPADWRFTDRSSLANSMIKRFERQHAFLQEQLQHLCSRPAVICDLWKVRAGHHKLGLSAVFIDNSWIMRRVCLGVDGFDLAHTSENIAVCFYEND